MGLRWQGGRVSCGACWGGGCSCRLGCPLLERGLLWPVPVGWSAGFSSSQCSPSPLPSPHTPRAAPAEAQGSAVLPESHCWRPTSPVTVGAWLTRGTCGLIACRPPGGAPWEPPWVLVGSDTAL